MEVRLGLKSFLKRIPFYSYLNKKNTYSNLSNFYKIISDNRSKLTIFLTTGILFSLLKNNNKLYCINENHRNFEDKVKAIQYNANEPCEDRYIALRLKNLNGDFLAVFDGHGGESVSQFASEKMAKYFDTIYLELKNKNVKNEKSEEEIVKQSLLDTFHKIVIN